MAILATTTAAAEQLAPKPAAPLALLSLITPLVLLALGFPFCFHLDPILRPCLLEPIKLSADQQLQGLPHLALPLRARTATAATAFFVARCIFLSDRWLGLDGVLDLVLGCNIALQCCCDGVSGHRLA